MAKTNYVPRAVEDVDVRGGGLSPPFSSRKGAVSSCFVLGNAIIIHEP